MNKEKMFYIGYFDKTGQNQFPSFWRGMVDRECDLGALFCDFPTAKRMELHEAASCLEYVRQNFHFRKGVFASDVHIFHFGCSYDYQMNHVPDQSDEYKPIQIKGWRGVFSGGYNGDTNTEENEKYILYQEGEGKALRRFQILKTPSHVQWDVEAFDRFGFPQITTIQAMLRELVDNDLMFSIAANLAGRLKKLELMDRLV